MILQSVAKKIFGTQNERELKTIYPLVDRINQLEATIKPLTDDQLKAKTAEFRERLSKGETLDSILPEAFATVREAAWRVIGQRHYDVQMIGGITLHRGRISEMKTGEGKTLVATLPSYLNALEGKGVHVITVNDYLARRDSEWMGRVHNFLGLSTGIIVHGLTDAQRKRNYACDITYGTNNEFGFDYLRDNMKFRLEDYVQREHNFAIVDEVDSILIDEARTPLIISGPSEASTELYYKIDEKVRGALTKDVDYTVDEKSKTVALTEAGIEKMEQRLGVPNLYDPINIEVLHHVNQSLRAHVLFKADVDYVNRDGEILIVDEFTGRIMPGRRWSDGLHQAIEAKEGVTIESENQTLATITFQNYFRMYKKLSGMTGTADTEATEFKQIYKLDVTIIPPNRINARVDNPDVIFKSYPAKFKEIAKELKRLHEKGQPVLVGTVSIEKSELLSSLLKQEGIKHNVLNAKQHEREAELIAQAGRKGMVTISTNMAGRGTDILLGGNPEFLAKHSVESLKKDATDEEKAEYAKKLEEAQAKWNETCAKEREEVKAAGGLFILGTERHESRRIDNQLRGRAGRQGDPGESRFYLSLDDDLMRIFGGVNIGRFMEDDMPIEHGLITRAIQNAQKKVEAHNYDIRKHLLEYDDVMNQQRKVIYGWRKEVLARENLRAMVMSMVEEIAANIAEEFFPGGKLRKGPGGASLDEKELNEALHTTFQTPLNVSQRDIQPFNNVGLKNLIVKVADQAYSEKEKSMGDSVVRQLEKMILLTTIDHLWKDHLLAMDHLREGIGLQGYGQKDPLIEYKKQGFKFFEMMMDQITTDVIRKLYAVQLAQEEHYQHEVEETFVSDKKPIQYNIAPDGSLIPIADPAQAGHGDGEDLDDETRAQLQLRAQQAVAQQRAQRANEMAAAQMANRARNMQLSRGPMGSPFAEGGGPGGMAAAPATAADSGVDRVGRNDPCPCGSGKKYKKCHGA